MTERDLERRVERLEDQQTLWLRFAVDPGHRLDRIETRLDRMETDVATLRQVWRR